MVIGTTNIDVEKVSSLMHDVDKLREYSKSLIPEPYRVHSEIVDNQLYYNVLVFRKESSKHIKEVKELTKAALRGIKVTGIINIIVTCDELEVF